MINRGKAMEALAQMAYELHYIAPNFSGYLRGKRMPVYFANGITKTYAFGENGSIHGYLAPEFMKNNKKKIQRMIGFTGSIVVIDSEGKLCG